MPGKTLAGLSMTLIGIVLWMSTAAVGSARPETLPIITPGTATTPEAEVPVEQARLLNNADRPTAALRLLNLALERDDLDEVTRFRGHFLRGQILQQQGELEAALLDYSEAIALQPDIAEVYAFRATIYFSRADFDAARDDYDRAIELDATQASYYLARGIVAAQLEDYDDAIDDFTTALEFDDSLAIAYRERGLAALAGDDVLQAADDLTTYLQNVPDAPDSAEIETILENLP